MNIDKAVFVGSTTELVKFLKNNKADLILSRSIITSFILTLFKIHHFLEIHSEFKGLTKFLMINLN